MYQDNLCLSGIPIGNVKYDIKMSFEDRGGNRVTFQIDDLASSSRIKSSHITFIEGKMRFTRIMADGTPQWLVLYDGQPMWSRDMPMPGSRVIYLEVEIEEPQFV